MNKFTPHKRQSLRLQNFDYTSPGAYFITICAQNRRCIFGEIINEKMKLNDYGKTVYDEWLKTGELRKNIVLDEFVVMPNHIHGIVVINGRVDKKYSKTTHGNFVDCTVKSKQCGVSCRGVLQYAPTPPNARSSPPNAPPSKRIPLPPKTGGMPGKPATTQSGKKSGHTKMTHKNNPKFRSPSQTIGAIVRGFKSAATKQINHKRKTPGTKIWQRNYWEHIIRNRNEYYRIRNYIKNNPQNWQADKFCRNNQNRVMETGNLYFVEDAWMEIM